MTDETSSTERRTTEPRTADEWDVIVLGAGPVGENVADRVVKHGLTAVVVERDLVGGSCSYHACSPSKAILRPIAARDGAAHVDGSGVSDDGDVDVRSIFRRRDSFVADYHDDGQVEWLESAGIDLVRGTGRLDGPRRVVVEARGGEPARTLTARRAVVVATGSVPQRPAVPGADSSEVWTSADALATDAVPRSLAIVGGGVVALEMATAFTGLGADVTVVARGPLLRAFEPFAGESVRGALEDRGVTFVEGEVQSLEKHDGGWRVTTTGGDVDVERVLLATGRRAAVEDLGLRSVGLEPRAAHGGLEVDDTLLVEGTDWLYACGDANGRALLTHQGKYQGLIAGDVIASRAGGVEPAAGEWDDHHATADRRAVSQVVFSAVEVASAGLTLAQALEQGVDARAVDADFDSVAGAGLYRDGYQGRARMVIDNADDTIVGATFVGSEVSELAFSAAVVVSSGVTLRRLRHAVPPFPTLSEIWLRLLAEA